MVILFILLLHAHLIISLNLYLTKKNMQSIEIPFITAAKLFVNNNSMAQCKTAVTPCSLALSHRIDLLLVYLLMVN